MIEVASFVDDAPADQHLIGADPKPSGAVGSGIEQTGGEDAAQAIELRPRWDGGLELGIGLTAVIFARAGRGGLLIEIAGMRRPPPIAVDRPAKHAVRGASAPRVERQNRHGHND
ncbi:hypothetical protein [Rhodopseudomonas sp. B29]|uniref:hypothetical protein n=1 Tax=Rhodopseudomonas sp. B29 TaxID=95607 RepID=UPI001FCB9219|nr:hypothetical protein [Rhodopseudomonas sp. B29]